MCLFSRLAGALILLIPAPSSTAQAQVADLGSQDAPAFSAQQLFAPPTSDWITNGGSLSNQRYSPIDSLNPTNVSGLKANWRASLNGSGSSPRDGNQAQPIVYGDSVYVMTGEGDAFAVDLVSGKVKWEFKANVDPKVARPCCAWPVLEAWRSGRVADPRDRPATGPDLFLHRESRSRPEWCHPQGRQPLQRQYRGAGCEDRQIPLALPGSPSRPLGL
jgi:hypothetical protein